jgi:diaminopimelate decarboxylase
MNEKLLPFSKKTIEKISQRFSTPFHIYDEKAIRENARRFLRLFSWNRGFKEFFAVKATPNPFIIKLLKDEGFGVDCSSFPELILAEKSGITGENIMFTSNDTPAHEFEKAMELGATINLDDISHIHFLEKHCGLPEVISIRYNPGRNRKGSFVMGNPEEAKYGFTHEQVFEGLGILKGKGVKDFGLHTFIASNELNPQYFVDTARMMSGLAREVKTELDIKIRFINISGGIGIPYKPEDRAVDLEYVSEGIQRVFREYFPDAEESPALYMECGRVITGPYGYLVSRVLHIKDIYKIHVGLDASMANLMRPAIYNAYHHITVLGKENEPRDRVYDVTGSLCESNDKFAINRKLPLIEIGDLLVIHDTGAHGHAMGFNYNGKLRSAELLLRETGEVVEIRRAETVDDYFASLDFDALQKFETKT